MKQNLILMEAFYNWMNEMMKWVSVFAVPLSIPPLRGKRRGRKDPAAAKRCRYEPSPTHFTIVLRGQTGEEKTWSSVRYVPIKRNK
jgi:hypothetical protein